MNFQKISLMNNIFKKNEYLELILIETNQNMKFIENIFWKKNNNRLWRIKSTNCL